MKKYCTYYIRKGYCQHKRGVRLIVMLWKISYFCFQEYFLKKQFRCNCLLKCVSLFFSGECRLLNVESPELNPLLSQAMESLQDRPVLFKYSLDEYANARRAAVVRSFIDALTRGGRSVFVHSTQCLKFLLIFNYIVSTPVWLHKFYRARIGVQNT